MIKRGFTLRALFLGAVLSFCIGAGNMYNMMVLRGSFMALDFTTPAAIFLLFGITLANFFLKKIKPSIALSYSELILIYCMMIVACAIPTMGLTLSLLPQISGLLYFATSENRWSQILHPFVKKWLVPQSPEAIRGFYEGLPKEELIPYSVWLKPLLAWIPFLLLLYFVMICIMIILRKQWIERERLAFPLTQVPMEMAKEEEGTHPFFKNKLMWIGFAFPLIIGSLIGLRHYFPVVPVIELAKNVHIFRNTMNLIFRVSFPMIGFTYFINSSLAFSLWFFNLLTTVQQGIFNVTGVYLSESMPYNTARPILGLQSLGALFVVVLSGLWMARRHLRDVARKAIFRDKEIDDSDEVLSYSHAFWGMVLGLLGMTLWLWMSGLPFFVTLIFLSFAFLIFIGITRVICEGGLAETRAPVIAPLATTALVGSSALGPSGLVALGFTLIYTSDVRTFVMASAANSLKLVEGEKKKKLFFWALILAIVVSLGSSIWASLHLGYKYGAVNANHWFFVSAQPYHWGYIVDEITNLTGPKWNHLGFVGIGAVIAGFLSFMRYRFLWWPFHPLGFAFSTIFLTNQIWFSIFLGWLFKSLLLRYGGPKVYKKARFFFLGLILGQFVCNGLWLVIDFLAGETGNAIFWI